MSLAMSLSLPPPAKASQTYLATSPTAEGEEDGSQEGGGESDGEPPPPPPPPPPAALVMTVAAAPGLTGGSPQVTGLHSGGRSKSQLEEVQEVRHLRFNCRRGKKNASREKAGVVVGGTVCLPLPSRGSVPYHNYVHTSRTQNATLCAVGLLPFIL